jgi:photosystem II stability/assembly factor-like uncharacterized protein
MKLRNLGAVGTFVILTALSGCGTAAQRDTSPSEPGGENTPRDVTLPPDPPDVVNDWAAFNTHVQPGSGLAFVDQDHGWKVNELGAEPHVDDQVQAAPIDSGFRWPGTGISTTSDGGATWSTVLNASDRAMNGLWGIDLLNAKVGWAVGVTGLMATTDGGQTWTAAGEPDGKSPLVRVVFADEQSGYGITGGGQVVRSDDGGSTWVAMPGAPDTASTVAVVNRSAIVVDQAGNIWREDAADRWDRVEPAQSLSIAPVWSELAVGSSSTIWASIQSVPEPSDASPGEVFSLLSSSDGGKTWTVAASQQPEESPDSSPCSTWCLYPSSLAPSDAGAVIVEGSGTSFETRTVLLSDGKSEVEENSDFAAGLPGPPVRDGAVAASGLIVQGSASAAGELWLLVADGAIGTADDPRETTYVLRSDDQGQSWNAVSEEGPSARFGD